AGIAVDHEDMAARPVEGHGIGVRAGLDALLGFQSLEIERSRLTRAPVIGVAAPARRRDRNAMGPAREACHLAQYPAVPAIDDRHSIAIRHIYPVRGGMEDHLVTSILGAERHRPTH